MLAHVLPEEIETLINVGDSGFLFREFQPPDGHELLDRRENVVFENFLRHPCHNEIIRISVDVDLALSARSHHRGHACIYCRFKSVQRHVRDYGRDYAAYDLAYFFL